MKISAVVILYYPDRKTVENILSYHNDLEKLYVIDNTDKPSAEIRTAILALSNCELIYDGENKGIAARLNEACMLAKRDGFEWLLTMDQDSYFDEGILNAYLKCLDAYAQKKETGMFGIQYENKALSDIVCKSHEVTHLITSGSIINLRVFGHTGGFDEHLFIDEVDLEYCYKCITAGYKIVQFMNIFMNHNLGEISDHTSFKTFRSTPRVLHSPIRMYYMLRNYFYINSKYKNKFGEDFPVRKKAIINRIKNNFLYGSQRLLLLKYLVHAVNDFRKGKMGKYQP